MSSSSASSSATSSSLTSSSDVDSDREGSSSVSTSETSSETTRSSSVNSSSNASQQKIPESTSQQPSSVERNPTLRFERPDNEYIPLPAIQQPKQLSQLLWTLLKDTTRYPWGTFRTLDYFRTAVDMFVSEVCREYKQQQAMAARNGRQMQRFMWKNSGELAVCFACVCDMMKLLFGSIKPGPLKPLWEVFVQQLTPVLMRCSRVPPTILSDNTYHTKFMDWQKGGTRYGGDAFKTNIRFPSVSERQVKVETFLRSGVGYQIQPVAVDPTTPMPSLSTKAPKNIPSPTNLTPPPVTNTPASLVPPHIPAKVVPLGNNAAGGVRAQPRSAASRRVPEEMRHLFWLSVLAHVKGGEPSAAFPDCRAPLMSGFSRLCDMSVTLEEKMVVVKVIRASSPGIQTVFERLGGVIAFRKFAAAFHEKEDIVGLMSLVDAVARLRIGAWSRVSQESWCTDFNKTKGSDLQWLRELPAIPPEKRPAWGALVLMMEEKYIFTPSLEALESQKKSTMELEGRSSSPLLTPMSGLRAVSADNVGMGGWKWPRLHTFNARRMPDEWRAPLFLSGDEESELQSYMEAKQKFLDEEQERWQESIRQMISSQRKRPGGQRDGGEGELPIPLWYNPLELLGVQPPKRMIKLESK